MSGIEEVTFTLGGRPYRLMSWRGGDPELYSIGPDGYTETFVGYAREALRTLACRAFAAEAVK